MKQLKTGTQTMMYFLAIIAFTTVLFACARKVHFDNSTVVPAAEGTVKVKKDDNNNHAIKVEVSNLAEPDKLQPARSVYVVWIETLDNGVKNLGQLKTSSGLLSGNLNASMETVSAFKPVRLFITAENEAGIQYPGTYVVLNTRNF